MPILGFIILIYSVILHEIAHGFVADKLGDPTARISKRLTLNPLPHIDPFNTILLPLLLLFANSPVIFGAAKPIPVDIFNLKEGKKDMALIALSGPATNIAIACFLAVIIKLLPLIVVNDALLSFLITNLIYGLHTNLLLAFFNLFPLPPLDGAKVLAGILPNSLGNSLLALERYGFWILFMILLFFPSVISNFTRPFVTFFSKILLNWSL